MSARKDSTATQNTIQKGLFAFVMIICLGLLMLPKPKAAPDDALPVISQTQTGIAVQTVSDEGQRP